LGLPELIARVLPTTVLPSASSLADFAAGAFSQAGRHCLYGMGDALFIGRESLVRDVDRLSEESTALFAPCFTNERGCATALTVEWLLGRDDRAALASFSGRGGVAALEEVLAALRVYGALPAADLRVLPALADRYHRMGGGLIAPTKAVIGEAIFSVESGIHVDGLCKSPDLYELFPPESVGRERRVIMGKHSGKKSVLAKCNALGLPITAELAERVLQKVKEESGRRKTSLQDADFIALYSACRAGKDERGEAGHAAL
jgi:homocitrate synthase NifV